MNLEQKIRIISASWNQLLTNLQQERKEKLKDTINIRNKTEDTTTDIADIKSEREYYKQLYTRKFDNLEENDSFLEKHQLPQ